MSERPAPPPEQDGAADIPEGALDDALQDLSQKELTIEGVPVDQIRWSRLYNRDPLTLSVSNKRFLELVKSMQAQGGNVSPVAMFPIETPPGELQKYELAYGHRRVMAARHLKLPKVAGFILPPLSRSEQARLQFLENSGRAEISVLEKARQIVSQFEAGAWATVTEMAAATGASRPHLSKLRTIGEKIPDALMMAHPDPARISYRDARRMVALVDGSPGVLEARIDQLREQRAKAVAGAPKVSPASATLFLLTGSGTAPPAPYPQSRLSRCPGGFRVSVLGLEAHTAEQVDEIIRSIEEAMAKHKVRSAH